jgi:orotidine-5'-phosphate decarboxylase
MLFGELGADAVTVTPYMGTDAVTPFTSYSDRGVFLVCLTSNPGADDVERLSVEGGETVYEQVARKALEWNAEHGNCGLVVGATQAESMAGLRSLAPDLPFLVPGIGAQGGDLATSLTCGLRTDGAGVLISTSRAVMHASQSTDFADAARVATLELRDQVNEVRRPVVGS